MIKKSLIYVFVLLISNLCLGGTIQSIKSGNWKDPYTWKNGIEPLSSDSVLINKGDTVFINSSSVKSLFLKNKGVIFFKSSTNSFNCSKISFYSGEITGNSLGTLYADSISFFGKCILGKCNLKVSDKSIIKDSLLITSSSGTKQMGSVINNGKLINIASEDINLSGNMENNGFINFNKGTLIFSTPALISGPLSVTKLKLADSLIIIDTVTITEEIIGKGKLINRGIVQLGMTDSKFKIDSLDLAFPSNEVHFIRAGKQTVPKISNNIAKKLIFRGKGIFTLNSYLDINTIEIRKNSSLEISSKIDLYSIACLDSSKLLTSGNFNLNEIKNLLFEKSSTLQINNNQELKRSIQIGDLIIGNYISLTLNGDKDTLKIGGNFSGNGILKGNPVFEYNGKARQFIKKRKYKKLIYNNSSKDSSTFYGNNYIDHLELKKGKLKIGDLKINKCQIHPLGKLIIGGNSPIFMDTTEISGSLVINSNKAEPKFNFLAIASNGKFQNNSSSDIIISNGIFNDGYFLGCLGTACDYIFLNDSILLAGDDTIFIPRIEAKNIYNHGIVFVKKKISTDSLFNLSNGTLLLASDIQNTQGIMDFTAKGNKLVFNKYGNQKTPVSLTNTHHLVFQNSGNKSISANLLINGNLEIQKKAYLKTDSFQIEGVSSGILSIDSLSSLSIGHHYSVKPITFPLNFSSVFCHDSSLVIYKSKGNQRIDSKPHYGNLTIEDGAVDSCEKDISGDSLIVKGSLTLAESSLTLVVKNKTVDLKGNWKGPGNLDLTKGTFYIGGNGSSNGLVNEGESEFIYNGVGSQKIKIGNYYNLTINKVGKAYTKADEGSLLVKNTVWIKNGTLDFNSERCDIMNLNIDDSVTFSSKYQEKYFKNILVNSTGIFFLNYDEEIYISGNINCHGSFVCKKGKVFFSDSLKTQKINGFGEIKMGQIVLSKDSSHLKIYSNLTLTDTLFLQHGNIELNSEIKLESLGHITGETSKNPITGIGKIYGNTLIKKGIYSNIKGLGITLTSSAPMGETLIERKFEASHLENGKGINRVYTIEPSLISNLDVTMVFNYWDSELNDNLEDELTLFKSNDFGNTWKEEGGAINTSNNSITLKGINSFSEWTAGTPSLNILAVELISFDALRKNDGSIFIDWEVLTELKTKAYQINYSFDGIYYDSLTTRNALNSVNYDFTWYDAPNQTIFFELVEIETDNNSISLDTTFVYPLIGREPEVWISKNKIHTKFFPTGVINIFDIRGKLILHNSFDISKLPYGVYYIELLNEIDRWTFEFTKY